MRKLNSLVFQQPARRRHNLTGQKHRNQNGAICAVRNAVAIIAKAANFCTTCGTALVASCPKCGAPIEPGERFCGECGAAIIASGPLSRPAPSQAPFRIRDAIPATEVIDGERKTVTALFADIKGSTELMAELDPEEACSIIDPALRLMIDAVSRD
jgi:hypothetical protein